MTQESNAPQLVAGFFSDRLTADRPLWVFLRTIRPEEWDAFYTLALLELQEGQHDDTAVRELRTRLLALEHIRRGRP
jgi:hypothetical protein